MKGIFQNNLLLLIIFIGLKSNAQQQPNFLFFESNMGIVNPAFTGSQGQLLGLQYRTAWIGVEDAPRLASFSYNTKEKNNASWGLNYVSDRIYVENQGVVSLDYSYKLQLSSDAFLRLGLKVGALYNNIDLDKLQRINTLGNTALNDINSYMNPLMGMGLYFKNKNTFLGLSVPNILNSKRFKEEQALKASATDSPNMYFTGGTSIILTQDLSFKPALLYRIVKDAPNRLSIIAKVEYNEKIAFGIGASNNDYISTLLLLKGTRNLDLGIGYEFGLRKSAATLNENTLEIIVKYKFSKKIKPSKTDPLETKPKKNINK